MFWSVLDYLVKRPCTFPRWLPSSFLYSEMSSR